MSTTYEDKINQMYDSQLTSQKEQLKTDYETTLSDMDAQQAAARKAMEKKLTDTRTDSQRAAVSNAEYYAAAGLSTGARAQARLSQENQLLADLTAIRAAQQQADAEAERQRTLLSKEYTSAIQKAQAENDLARAQALYAEAKDADAQLLAKEEAAANLMAGVGDYTRLGELYGLTPEELKALSGVTAKTAVSSSGGTGNKYSGQANNGSVAAGDIEAMQKALGVTVDGRWGPKTREAAEKKWGTTDPDEAWRMFGRSTPYASIARDLEIVTKEDRYDDLLKMLEMEGGSDRQAISAYVHAAVNAGYITQSQGQVLLNRFLSKVK